MGIPYVKRTCPQCNQLLETKRWSSKRFCSVKCGVEFKVDRWKPNHFCSKECRIKHLTSGKTLEERTCQLCGKIFKIEPFKPKKYCTRSCYQTNIKQSRIHPPDKRQIALKTKEGNFVHRQIVEDYLGIKLQPHHRVHHIDMNNHNNDLKNLYVYDSPSMHQKGHTPINKLVAQLLLKQHIIFKNGNYILGDK